MATTPVMNTRRPRRHYAPPLIVFTFPLANVDQYIECMPLEWREAFVSSVYVYGRVAPVTP